MVRVTGVEPAYVLVPNQASHPATSLGYEIYHPLNGMQRQGIPDLTMIDSILFAPYGLNEWTMTDFGLSSSGMAAMKSATSVPVFSSLGAIPAAASNDRS